MGHEATLIATVAAAFGLSLILGFIAAKLRMPPLIGYLLAGIAIGPYTRGFVGDVELAGQLADIGVMLLMFGVGLHFSIDDLSEVRHVAVPGAIVQMIAAAALATALALFAWHWSRPSAIVFGISLCVSSTVVLLRVFESRRQLTSLTGRVAVGWLVVQDLAMVLVLVIVPPLAGGGGVVAARIAITLGKAALFVVFMLVVGRRVFPRLLWLVASTGSRELFTLCVVAAAVGVAFGSAQLFGVSFALGAFFAGMMMRESSLSHRAAEDSLPLQDAFAVLFFVSVGMLFDPMVLVRQPLAVLSAVAVVMIGTPVVAIATILLFRHPLATAVTVGAGLAQIGEFSFILAGLGVSLGLLSRDAHNVVLGAALITIAANPFVVATAAPLAERMRRRSAGRHLDPLAELPMTVEPSLLTNHVVIVGYGRVGGRIAAALSENGIAYVVVEQNREIVERLRRQNVPAVSGDAAEPEVLVQAHVARAKMLVVATPDIVPLRAMVKTARMLNPKIDVVLRTHDDEEAELLRREQAGGVFMGEHELAAGMTRYILGRYTEKR